MKKSVLLGIAALALASAAPAAAQEVQYVPDCSQGVLINKNKDNWFLTLEGGANMLFGKGDIHAELKDRICGNGAIYLGKWVTPNFGFRFGANYIMTKGATTKNGPFWKENAPNQLVKDNKVQNGWYAQKWMGLGPEFDVMVNLTNWWCGYRPGRVYNAVVHGGAGAYWRWYENKDAKWKPAHNTIMFASLGLQNNFRLSKHVDFFIDLQYELIDCTGEAEHVAEAFLGFNFNFGKTDWNCPVTAICPTWKYTDAEGDALVAKLAAADNEIAKLKKQLEDCLNAPKPKDTKTRSNQVEYICDNMVIVYYPINQYSLSAREQKILKSCAEVMIENPGQKYVLTGWADNYTGNDEINVRLRQQRVDGVYNYLVKCGVNPDQLDARIDNSNLTDYGIKGAPLDRAVTINVAD